MSELTPDLWPHVLSTLVTGTSLSADESAEAMLAIMREEATPAQVAGFLMALRSKGETVEELEGAARAALEMARPVTPPAPVVDTCGTGGDRSGTFNISTVSAIVVAGAGVPVAKHGNRAASSACGSADVLESLGVKIDLGPEGVERCLAEVGIAFMFAPVFHPAAAYAAGIRRELRIPTVFNFLGPLTNPARPTAQVVGVSDPRMLPLVAEVLARRGTRAKVFRGQDGLDELTTTGPSVVHETRDGAVEITSIDPAELGFPLVEPDAIRGGNTDTNAEIARRVLAGEPGPHRDVVVLNAGAALEVAARAADLADGMHVAAGSIDSGAASGTLERWAALSRSL